MLFDAQHHLNCYLDDYLLFSELNLLYNCTIALLHNIGGHWRPMP